jgi:hypothetical protein
MKPKPRAILDRCIENGIAFGWAHAHKHTDTPQPQHIQQEIEHAIWLEIDEFFSFEDEAGYSPE